MKKYLIPISLIALLIAQNAVSAPFQPVHTMVIPSTFQPMAMDGNASEGSYGEEQSTWPFTVLNWEGTVDLDASFRMSWNPEFLFLYVEITDDINHSYDGGIGDYWDFDNFIVFLQLDTNTVMHSYGPTTGYVIICRGRDSVEWPGRANRSEFLYYMNAHADMGWIAEVAIPWTSIMPSGMYIAIIDGRESVRFIKR